MCSWSVTQLCPTLYPLGLYSLPGFSTHGFFRQEHWSGLPLPTPGDFPNPPSLGSLALVGKFFTTVLTWKLTGGQPTIITCLKWQKWICSWWFCILGRQAFVWCLGQVTWNRASKWHPWHCYCFTSYCCNGWGWLSFSFSISWSVVIWDLSVFKGYLFSEVSRLLYDDCFPKEG